MVPDTYRLNKTLFRDHPEFKNDARYLFNVIEKVDIEISNKNYHVADENVFVQHDKESMSLTEIEQSYSGDDGSACFEKVINEDLINKLTEIILKISTLENCIVDNLNGPIRILKYAIHTMNHTVE